MKVTFAFGAAAALIMFAAPGAGQTPRSPPAADVGLVADDDPGLVAGAVPPAGDLVAAYAAIAAAGPDRRLLAIDRFARALFAHGLRRQATAIPHQICVPCDEARLESDPVFRSQAALILNDWAVLQDEVDSWSDGDSQNNSLTAALALRRRVPPPDRLAAAVTAFNLGAIRSYDPIEAEALQRNALTVLRRDLARMDYRLTAALARYAQTLSHQRRKAEAEAFLREAIAGERDAGRGNGLQIADAYDALAGLLAGRGESTEAETLLRRAVAIRAAARLAPGSPLAAFVTTVDWESLGIESPGPIAVAGPDPALDTAEGHSLGMLARLLADGGRYQEARSVGAQAIERAPSDLDAAVALLTAELRLGLDTAASAIRLDRATDTADLTGDESESVEGRLRLAELLDERHPIQAWTQIRQAIRAVERSLAVRTFSPQDPEGQARTHKRLFLQTIRIAWFAEQARVRPIDYNVTSFFVDFDVDRSELSHEATATLNHAALVMLRHRGSLLRIRGQADRTGATDSMAGLSQRRANSIRNYLASRGVPAGAILTGTSGRSQPAVDAPGGIDRRNRRVLIEIAFPGTPRFNAF